MIIDAFAHIAPVAYLDKLASMGGSLIKKRSDMAYAIARQRPQLIDVTRRLEQLDKFGITMEVVTAFHDVDCNSLSSDRNALLTMARALNEAMARLADESRGRLLGAGGVPLAILEQGGLQEMERAIQTLGLRAIALPSHIQGKPLDSPEFMPFWARAAELGIPVYIHPINPVAQDNRSYEAEYELSNIYGWPFETSLALARLVFSGIMELYPNLKIVSHHLGGMVPFFWGRMQESYSRLRESDAVEAQARSLGKKLPRPATEYFSLFYYDTAVGGNAAAIRCAYEIFGADRLLFATDLPFGPKYRTEQLDLYHKAIDSLGLPDVDRVKIMGGNARRLLGLE